LRWRLNRSTRRLRFASRLTNSRQESTGTGKELASKIAYFQFEKCNPTAVAPLHVLLQLLMQLPGPEAAALRAVTGEVYIRANVNDLDLRQAMEQKGAALPKDVEDVAMADLPRSEEAKQESKERVRDGDDGWLHASPGPEAKARAAVFRGFSALDDLAQAKLLCLIYKGIDRAKFADAMCKEIDAATSEPGRQRRRRSRSPRRRPRSQLLRRQRSRPKSSPRPQLHRRQRSRPHHQQPSDSRRARRLPGRAASAHAEEGVVP